MNPITAIIFRKSQRRQTKLTLTDHNGKQATEWCNKTEFYCCTESNNVSKQYYVDDGWINSAKMIKLRLANIKQWHHF